jgi:hypothetical protein
MNRLGNAVKMLEWMRDNTVSVTAQETKDTENKLKIGVLWETEAEEYTEIHKKLVKKAMGGKE